MRRVDWSKRCPQCWMHWRLCLCEQAPRLKVDTGLVLLMDRREACQTTNTGHMAPLVLERSKVVVTSRQEPPDDKLQGIVESGRRAVLLFPGHGAQVLTPQWLEGQSEPLTLVVPDATWRVARRTMRKSAILRRMQPVVLPPGPPARWYLRRPPEPGVISTLEAIARAMGVLEGQHVEQALMKVLRMMVQRHMWSKGLLEPEALVDGVPPPLPSGWTSPQRPFQRGFAPLIEADGPDKPWRGRSDDLNGD